MKKFYKFAGLIVTLPVTVTVGIIIHRLLFKPHVWLSTSSPNGTYAVELTGDKGRGGFIFDSIVNLNAIRNGQPIIGETRPTLGMFVPTSWS